MCFVYFLFVFRHAYRMSYGHYGLRAKWSLGSKHGFVVGIFKCFTAWHFRFSRCFNSGNNYEAALTNRMFCFTDQSVNHAFRIIGRFDMNFGNTSLAFRPGRNHGTLIYDEFLIIHPRWPLSFVTFLLNYFFLTKIWFIYFCCKQVHEDLYSSKCQTVGQIEHDVIA